MNKIKLSSALLDVKINKENSIYKNLIWTTKNGDKIPFIELKESHIDNIIRLFGDKEIEIEFKIQPIPLDEVFFKGFKDLPEEHQEIIAESWGQLH